MLTTSQQMQLVVNDISVLIEQVARLENELEHSRAQVKVKDELIKKQENRIERQNNQIEEMLLQKRTLVNNQKKLEDQLKKASGATAQGKKGSKPNSQKIEDVFSKTKRQLVKSGNHFVDQEFPPQKVSLIENWDDTSELTIDIKDEWKQFEWIRTDQIPVFNTDPSDKLEIFKNGIEPADIVQGKIDNSYLLAAIAAIAEGTDRTTKMFLCHEVNSQGVYGIWSYINGEKKQCLVDSYFPCKNLKPVFSKAKGKELWVMIIEKAWAKMHKSYQRIISG